MSYEELLVKLIDLKESGRAISRMPVVFEDGSEIIDIDFVSIGDDEIVLS